MSMIEKSNAKENALSIKTAEQILRNANIQRERKVYFGSCIMEIALNKNKERVHADEATRQEEYFCPICHGSVILRKGEVKISHFAHRACACTDSWHYDMSEWHKRKQSFFDKQYQEIVLTHNGKTHRADILKDGVVIEFQHSPISNEEFNERNRFYTSLGYKIAWVFDVTDQIDMESLDYCGSDNRLFMRWSRPKVVLKNIYPKDYGTDISIWLCWDNEFPYILADRDPAELDYIMTNNIPAPYYGDTINKVIWSSKDENGDPDYKRILLSPFSVDMHKNMSGNEFFYSKRDRINFMTYKHKPYEIKYNGIKGKPRKSYVCPKTNEFGLSLYGDGCQDCQHCIVIENKGENEFGKNSHLIYCAYPKTVRDKDDYADIIY